MMKRRQSRTDFQGTPTFIGQTVLKESVKYTEKLLEMKSINKLRGKLCSVVFVSALRLNYLSTNPGFHINGVQV